MGDHGPRPHSDDVTAVQLKYRFVPCFFFRGRGLHRGEALHSLHCTEDRREQNKTGSGLHQPSSLEAQRNIELLQQEAITIDVNSSMLF